MIDNFKLFGIEHILSILFPILITGIFVFLARKFSKKQALIGIFLAIAIIAIRSVRYVFDIQLGLFQISDIFSLHICNISLWLLVYCLIKPNRQIFSFLFLIGIPTALSVVLMPGRIHPEPGMARAVFFIMSHMMLVTGAIYLLLVNKFEITKKDLKIYYLLSLVGIVLVYTINIIFSSNYMYLINGPKGTVLSSLSEITGGGILYTASIYIILIIIISAVYGIYKLTARFIKR